MNSYVDENTGKDSILRSGKNGDRAFKTVNYAVWRSDLRRNFLTCIYWDIRNVIRRLRMKYR